MANQFLEGNPYITPKPAKKSALSYAPLAMQLYNLSGKGKAPQLRIGDTPPGEPVSIPEPVSTEGLNSFNFGQGGEQLVAPSSVEATPDYSGWFDFNVAAPAAEEATLVAPEMASEYGMLTEAELAGYAAEEAAASGVALSAVEEMPVQAAMEFGMANVADAGPVFVESGASAGAEAGGSAAGASAGGLASALPYAVIGNYLAKAGGKTLENKWGHGSSNVGSQVGRTMQDPWQGIGRPWAKEIFSKQDYQGWVAPTMDVLNPLGVVFRKIGCIIVTACTSPDSEEVNIAREYRDKFLTPEQLRGYYMIAERIVPLMVRYPAAKRFVKRHLVDHVITYGRNAMHGGTFPPISSFIITTAFLWLCLIAGSMVKSFKRCNGEEV